MYNMYFKRDNVDFASQTKNKHYFHQFGKRVEIDKLFETKKLHTKCLFCFHNLKKLRQLL